MTLQSILGRNYKWWYIIKHYFKIGVTYFWSDFFWYLANSVNFLMFLFLWQISGRQDSKDVISYLLMGNLFFALSANQSSWNIFQKIFDGKITANLIMPISVISSFFAMSLGYSLKITISTMISLIPIFAIYNNQINLNGNFWVLGLLPVVFVIRYFISLSVGMSSFWIKDSVGLISFYENILPVLAGSLVPLSLLPIPFLDKTPLSYLFYHPMQIYLGKYSQLEILQTFCGGILWCLVLFILARIVFKMGLKRNEAVGL